MAHALPLAKLASLMMKTAAKPLSKQVKHQFSKNTWGQQILASIGQANHQITSRMTIWSSGYRVRSINPLDRKEAMKQGADFIGEAVVVGVSAGLLVWEYNRSNDSTKKKEEKKQAAAKAERDALQAKLVTLDVRLKALEEVVKTNQASILLNVAKVAGLGGKQYHEPKNTVKIQEDDGDDDDDATDATVDEETALQPQKKRGRWWLFGL